MLKYDVETAPVWMLPPVSEFIDTELETKYPPMS